MITRIELNNFQAHKHTVIDLDKGVNVITGETDNGKSSIVRAIRWVVENYPQGIDKINSNWNEDLKEPLSVKLYTEKGYVERIRAKDRNGYNICKNGEKEIKLDAIGKGNVPKEVTEFLNVSDVNFQYQLDPPYLLSMTAGNASQYLNKIVHLDSIDEIMSRADSNKRQLNSEDKIVDGDIKKITEELEMLSWVSEAEQLALRVGKLDEIVGKVKDNYSTLETSIQDYTALKNTVIDLSEAKELTERIDEITVSDFTVLEREIESYKSSRNSVTDLSEVNRLISEIEKVSIIDYSELEREINEYTECRKTVQENSSELEKLNKMLPDTCPYCGSQLTGVCECL